MSFAALRKCDVTTELLWARTCGALGYGLLHWGSQPLARKVTGELAAAPFLALDRKLRAMPLQHVLDDRQTQAGTEKCPPCSSVHQRICTEPSSGVYLA